MESDQTFAEADLVRCLDCGTVYPHPVSNTDSGPCPTCGYVGWIALRTEQEAQET
jgi:predicted  nucleic acid-binding Zn-ribbon protein